MIIKHALCSEYGGGHWDDNSNTGLRGFRCEGFAEGAIILLQTIAMELFSWASKEKASYSHYQWVRICEYSGTSPLQPPSSINPYIYPVLHLDSEWVTLLFTIFPIPSQVFGLAGSAALSLAITGLWGFSNGAFEEITLFSSSSREKSEDILARSVCSQSRQFCLTHLVAKISSDLV